MQALIIVTYDVRFFQRNARIRLLNGITTRRPRSGAFHCRDQNWTLLIERDVDVIDIRIQSNRTRDERRVSLNYMDTMNFSEEGKDSQSFAYLLEKL